MSNIETDLCVLVRKFFQRRPKGLSLAITIYRRMSHAFSSVSRIIIQSMSSIGGQANRFIENEGNYTLDTDC